jgi:peroxiredoxin
MSTPINLSAIPDDLPVPENDGACDHLTGRLFPAVTLQSTAGRAVDLGALPGRNVLYCYPRTGQPGVALPGGWDSIPGARGCTPEACNFRDHHAELRALGVMEVFGLSTQDTAYQKEAAIRLELTFELLSDHQLAFAQALNLPTFVADGMTLIKRVTMVIDDGKITKFFYPVFPPDKAAETVLEWVKANPR